MNLKVGLGFGVAVALTLGVASSASAGTLDQQQTSSSSNESLVANPNQSGAQTFTAGISGGLDQADLKLIKFGTPPAPVTVEIRTTSAGNPSATVLATGTIATSAVGESPGFVPVTFAMPAPVTAGTQYALVAYSAGASGNLVSWSEQGGNPYPGGQFFLSFDPLPPGANWSGAPAEDFAFKTYVVPSPPAPPSNPATTQPATKKKCKKHKKKHRAGSAKKHCKKKK